MFDVMARVDPLLDESVDPVQRIETAVADLAGEDRDHWTGPMLSERVTELIAAHERLGAEILRLTGHWDRQRAWEADGSPSPLRPGWNTTPHSPPTRPAD